MNNNTADNQEEPSYSPAFIKRLNEARASKAKGELIEVDPTNVWASIDTGSPQSIWFQDESIFIKMPLGEQHSMPLKWFPRLLNASPAEREKFELSPFGIHWPDLDEDLSFEGFFTYSPPNFEK